MISERSAIVGKLLAQMMVMSGFSQIITMDLHQKELQGFFDCPVDNLRASPFFITYIVQHVRFGYCRLTSYDLSQLIFKN